MLLELLLRMAITPLTVKRDHHPWSMGVSCTRSCPKDEGKKGAEGSSIDDVE